MKAALYARVSTMDKDQNPEVQLVPMRSYCQSMEWSSRDYIDKSSAADLVHRIAWAQMMKDASLRRFDILIVWKLDRAFRSLIHAKTSIELLRRYGIHFRSLNDPGMDTNTPNGELLFNLIASFAQYEKDLIAQRVIAGMEYAKVHGTKSGLPIGKPRQDVDLPNICHALSRNLHKDGSFNYTAAARDLSYKFNKSLNPGFVYLRIKREAKARNMTREDLVQDIMTNQINNMSVFD
jgi:DNA invertase Pin-like site-specific DNA recombinase